MPIQCGKCGRFVKDVKCWTNGFGDIVRAEATCSKCGKLNKNEFDWVYETFFPEEEEK